MKYFFIVLLLFSSGCVYVNNDVGLTTYKYEKCNEYYDANGVYHKECADSLDEKIYNTIYFWIKDKPYETPQQKNKRLEQELKKIDKLYQCKSIKIVKPKKFDRFKNTDTKVKCVR